MSLISHSFFPRSAFDMDSWLRPSSLLPSPLSPVSPASLLFLASQPPLPLVAQPPLLPGLTTLDIFDPFDELDRVMGRNLMWLDLPEAFKAIGMNPQPSVPAKYRIQVHCAGFSPSSIKTQLSEDKRQLVVSAKEGADQPPSNDADDFYLREFRRTYTLPANADTDKLISFVTSNNRLVIEMPIKEEQPQQPEQPPQQSQVPAQQQASEASSQIQGEGQFPPIVERPAQGSQNFQMSMSLPSGIEPADVNVICKDRDVIVQTESKTDSEDKHSRLFYYRRVTLPENANLSELKCTYDNNKLCIQAPVYPNFEQTYRTIPIEMPQQQQSQSPQLQQQQSQPQQLSQTAASQTQPEENQGLLLDLSTPPTDQSAQSQPSQQPPSLSPQPSAGETVPPQEGDQLKPEEAKSEEEEEEENVEPKETEPEQENVEKQAGSNIIEAKIGGQEFSTKAKGWQKKGGHKKEVEK